MKKLILFILLSSFTFNVFSQSLHVFSLIDGRLITTSTDRKNVEEIGNNLGKLLELKLEKPVKEDPLLFKYNDFLTNISKIQQGDVILFYFGGEGDGDKKDKSLEKQFVFFQNTKITHKEIVDLVAKQKPRMAIILVEGTKKQALENEGEYEHDHAGVISKTNASKLFQFKNSASDKGAIIYMNATQPPNPAQKNRITGSYFLASFKNNLYNELGESEPNWDNIRNNVEMQVKKFTRGVQAPYGSMISIK